MNLLNRNLPGGAVGSIVWLLALHSNLVERQDILCCERAERPHANAVKLRPSAVPVDSLSRNQTAVGVSMQQYRDSGIEKVVSDIATVNHVSEDLWIVEVAQIVVTHSNPGGLVCHLETGAGWVRLAPGTRQVCLDLPQVGIFNISACETNSVLQQVHLVLLVSILGDTLQGLDQLSICLAH